MEKKNSQIVIDRKTVNVILIVVILLIIGALTFGLGWSSWFGEKQATGKPQFDIDPNAGEWNGGQLPDASGGDASEGIKIPGYPSITLPKNQQTVNTAFLNPAGNPCYFTFEVVLKVTGESLYKSKLVPPGQAIMRMTMTRALAEGEYAATLKITTTSLTDGSAMNGANVETVLIVK